MPITYTVMIQLRAKKSIKIAINNKVYRVRDNARNSVRNSVRKSVRVNVWVNIWDNIWDSVSDSVMVNTYTHLINCSHYDKIKY
jgi:hypothetical protein